MFVTGGVLHVLNHGTLTVASTAMRQKFLDRVSGEGFFLSNKGERMSIADGLDSACGQEFTAYVRNYLNPSPYSHTGPAGREIKNLWPERKLKLFLKRSRLAGKRDG
jgi:hypothetical protein